MANRNEDTYRGRVDGGMPWIIPGLFQSGADQAIFQGMMLKHDGTRFVPLTADESTDSVVAVAKTKVESGDLAGYRPIYVPQPKDLFEFTLLSTDTQNPTSPTDLYISATNSDSFTVTTTAGSNVIAVLLDYRMYPEMQGHQAHDASKDRETTIKAAGGGKVLIAIRPAESYYTALIPVA
jgi:hypothetical protein